MSFSCLAYLSTSVSLISSRYDEQSRLREVVEGLHGLCRYASSYWVEHLLEFLRLRQHGVEDSRRDSILHVAENVATKLMNEANEYFQRYRLPPKLDERCELLDKGRPLYKFVVSALDAQLREKIAPRNGIPTSKFYKQSPDRKKTSFPD